MTAGTFKEAYFALHPKLYRIGFSILKNAEDTEDMIQDLYCKLWDGREKLATIQNPEAYCITLLKNLCFDLLHKPVFSLTDPMDEECDIPDMSPDVETTISYKDTLSSIKSIIHRLPAKQQRILELRVFADCSSEEIEKITGESAENVRVLLSRARNTLRNKLKY